VHVDETGWRTRGEGRALWTATTPRATFLQIAEHCNREQFNALIGTTYPGIVISDRWNGYSLSTPTTARCAGHTSGVTFAATPTGSPNRRSSERPAFSSPAGCSPPGAPTNTNTTTATDARPRSRRSKQNSGSCAKTRARNADGPAGAGSSPTTSSESGQRSDLHHPRGRRADQQPRRTRSLGRRDLPHATPLAVHLPQRTTRRAQPRRPVPRAHLSPRD
jgi:hypothetical protein